MLLRQGVALLVRVVALLPDVVLHFNHVAEIPGAIFAES